MKCYAKSQNIAGHLMNKNRMYRLYFLFAAL